MDKKLIQDLTALSYIQEGLKFLEADQDYSITEQIDLTCIEAPTGHEHNRAKELCKKFTELGLEDIHIDGLGNAMGTLKGTEGKSTILIEAHMDTVFPLGSVTSRPEIDENGIIHAPGIGDNTRGLAVVLAVLRAMKKMGIQPKNDIIFAGTCREEGSGSLGGIRYLLNEHPEIKADLSVDGGGFTNICFNATGIKTLRYTFKGKSGHSFGHFRKIAQTPHALGRAIAAISDLEVPVEPASCFAVTSVTGGTFEGLHAIPEECSFIVNYRSNDAKVLKEIEDQIENCVKEAVKKENEKWNLPGEITYFSELLCDAPAGNQSDTLEIVQAFAQVIEYMGEEPSYSKGGCTNANVPISLGIPAVCMGGGKPIAIDTHVHSLSECFPIKDAYKCPQAAFILLNMLAGTKDTDSLY